MCSPSSVSVTDGIIPILHSGTKLYFLTIFLKNIYFLAWKCSHEVFFFFFFLNKLSVLLLHVYTQKVSKWKYCETSGITSKSIDIYFSSGLWNTTLSTHFPVSIICFLIYLILLLEVYEMQYYKIKHRQHSFLTRTVSAINKLVKKNATWFPWLSDILD